MNKKLVAVTVLGFSLAQAAQAGCFHPGEVATLQGVITTKATYIAPGDFGWAPANGFQEYDAFVSKDPICFDDATEGQYANKVYVIQIAAGQIAPEAKKNGVKATIKGKIFYEHTAHHFQQLLMVPESISIE